ncbi:hypothetical protein HDU84_006881 [Entophlyctis sp. JEL0112]|nr:hypothetical protein HDU84_006881 [Entophlyctis sp. JEL0112]
MANSNDGALATWGRGHENQRIPDLGNGLYRNPVFPGDHPDPSILKDGDIYYLVHSSFDVYPGLVIYTSRDLINWTPVTAALSEWVGSVWAPFMTKHLGKYYIYFPARGAGPATNYVITADAVAGPWSSPHDLHAALPPGFPSYIDPSHIIGEDGKRYMFVAGTHYMQLTDDGHEIVQSTFKLAVKDWPIPDSWVVEGPAPEGPKVARVGDYFYLNVAQGGTAGPPTSHMTLSYRSKSVHGPWELSPYNPVIYTASPADPWWSKGHGTLVEGPNGRDYYVVFHGYEKDYATLGRQTLLSPIEFTDDGWWRLKDMDVSTPQPMPLLDENKPKFNIAYSDDFSTDKFGIQWGFYSSVKPTPEQIAAAKASPRHRFEKTPGPSLVLACKGSGPADSDPLTFKTGDHAYEMTVKITLLNPETAIGGAVLFYNSKMFAGLGFDGHGTLIMHRYGTDRRLPNHRNISKDTKSLFIKLQCDYVPTTLTMWTSTDGIDWKRYENQINVSTYEHNAAYDFLSLRPGIYAAGKGEVRFENVTYTALDRREMVVDVKGYF